MNWRPALARVLLPETLDQQLEFRAGYLASVHHANRCAEGETDMPGLELFIRGMVVWVRELDVGTPHIDPQLVNPDGSPR